MKRKTRVITRPVNIAEELHDWLKSLAFKTEVPMRDLASQMIEYFKLNPELVEKMLKENKKEEI